MSKGFCLSYWRIGMEMNQQNNLFFGDEVLGNHVLICRYITLAFLMMHFGSFCIVFHIFAAISDFFLFFGLVIQKIVVSL